MLDQNLENITENTRDIQIKDNVILLVKSHLSKLSKKDKGNDLNLYNIILNNVEVPLLRTVMEQTRYNQSKASRVLGISRGTLRSKLKQYFGEEFLD